MLDAGADYGRGVVPPAQRRRINVEYVSANPVGPLHVGNARYGAMGDALCRVFEFAGHDVGREYYVNDAGRQMRLFGQTLAARYAEAARPRGRRARGRLPGRLRRRPGGGPRGRGAATATATRWPPRRPT